MLTKPAALQRDPTAEPWALGVGEALNAEMARLRAASKPRLRVFDEQVVSRTATFCPGCPHRDSSSVLLQIRKDLADPEYMRQTHNKEAVDLVAHGDTGCYTMLMFAPTEQLMHNYSGMGLGGGTGSGIDPFITNKQIVFMGDGTFFHSGQVAISNAIKAGQDLTFIILENGTTAMTGHQEHAGTEIDLMGNRSYIQDIYSIVSGMKGTSELTVTKINPAERSNYRKTLEETILRSGVKVIIADKECGITYHRRKNKEEKKTIKEHGFLPRKVHMNVTPEVCENCLECTKQTACPGLTSVDTERWCLRARAGEQ
jgi:indolepyruvate ferredoxin oxidoreductase